MANSLDGTVSRIDPETNVAVTIPSVGNGPTGVAVDLHGVWVSNQFDGTLVRIDPRTNQVARRISVGNQPQGVAISGDEVLVSVGQSSAGHRGGTLTVRTPGIVDSIDTALVDSTTEALLLRMTNDGLVAFNETSGLAGAQLVPDLAVSLPTPTGEGRTYTFRLRPNIRYSNGRLVKASDVRSTFERDFEIGELPATYYGIVGAARCNQSPKRCDLSRGIVADDAARTVTFHLVAADPDFLYKLALTNAYVLPAGTPPQDTGARPLPATGPYVIASYRPAHVLKFVRNRYFREWSKAAQPDGYPDTIVYRIDGTADEAVDAVIRGQADAFGSVVDVPSREKMTEIETRFASQVHSNSFQRIFALFLNTRVAPFDSLDARKALNYAADRAAAVKVAGGPDVAQATCQILPSNFPGYRPYCPYSAGTAVGRQLEGAGSCQGAGPGGRVRHGRYEGHLLGLCAAESLRCVRGEAAQVAGVPRDDEGPQQNEVLLCRPRPSQSGAGRVFRMGCRLSGPVRILRPAPHVRVGELERLGVLQPAHRPGDRGSPGRAGDEPPGGPSTVGTHRPADRRPGAVGAARQPEGRRCSLEASRQLPVQPDVGDAGQPALGALAGASPQGSDEQLSIAHQSPVQTEGQSSLSSRARATASGRVATPSLRKMLFTWVLTVLNET